MSWKTSAAVHCAHKKRLALAKQRFDDEQWQSETVPASHRGRIVWSRQGSGDRQIGLASQRTAESKRDIGAYGLEAVPFAVTVVAASLSFWIG
jgi:ADP-ribosylglycohydrolase